MSEPSYDDIGLGLSVRSKSESSGRDMAFADVGAIKSHAQETAHEQAGIGDINSKEKGSAARYNGGKPDMSLIPMWTLEGEARVWEYGLKKYAPWNWTKGMPWLAVFASLMRHLFAWQRGEDIDQESGLPHLDLASANLRMLIYYAKKYKEGDNRLKD